MKKYKYLLITLLIPLLIPITTYADCTEENIQEFKEIQDEYKVTYEFDKETKLYTIIMNNPESSKYDYSVDDENVYANCNIMDETKIKCENVNPGSYLVEIYDIQNNCEIPLKKISLDLPKYNDYSEDPLCEGLEDFYLCQSTYDKAVDYDTFVARVELYKKSLEEKKDTEQKQETTSESKIIKYIKDNIIQIIIITVFVIMIVITIALTVKTEKQSRRLE